MATNTFVEINLPEAARLADLTGILYDLTSARYMAQLLAKVWSVNAKANMDLALSAARTLGSIWRSMTGLWK